jgi:hypothetical protein
VIAVAIKRKRPLGMPESSVDETNDPSFSQGN